MPNNSIFDSVSAAWSSEDPRGKKLLDLSCGGGHTAAMLAKLGYQVVATDYGAPPALSGDRRVGGVDLNAFLPFRSASFDAVDLVEVIEHIENQPQLIREIARVLKPNGVVLISTPNILNMMSRVRFYLPDFSAVGFARRTIPASRGRRRIFICCIFTSFIICCFTMALK